MVATGTVGRHLIRASDLGTVVFTVVAVASTVALQPLKAMAVAVSLALFVAGCATFLWAFAVAVGRSRTDAIGIGGLYFLQGTAPRATQVRLVGAFVVQSVVALVAAATHPFTSLAFVILAPMYGLGLSGLWGARHGHFEPRSH